MPTQPNVIYILGDDQRGEYLGAAGHPILQTPNIDAMAREGTYFPKAFCTSPACTPSRACHYLGQWERRHGVNFNSSSAVAESAWERSFPMELATQGYFLGWVGKNHVPAGQGGYGGGYFERVFDYWWGNHGHSGFYPKERTSGAIYRNAAADTQVEAFEEGVMNFLDPQKGFLESCSHPLPRRPEDRPFCLCVTFNLPHGASTGTMQLRPSDDELYKSAYRDRINDMPVPVTYKDATEEAKDPKLPRYVYSGRRIRQYDYVKGLNTLRERQVRTCQTVSGVDRFVGRLREKLAALGLADNTIIVFSTDHGLHHGEHGLGGKCFLFEEDVHIPLVVYDPRLPAEARGQVRQEMVAVPDLAPTVMELTGASVPETMQGTSLVPLIRGESVPWREELFLEQQLDRQDYPRSEAVRTAEWKYIRYFRRNEDPTPRLDGTHETFDDYTECLFSTLNGEQPVYEELYHLKEDPSETINLAMSSEHTDTLAHFRRRILELGRQARVDDAPPATVPV